MAHNVILSELDYLYTKVPKRKKKKNKEVSSPLKNHSGLGIKRGSHFPYVFRLGRTLR